MDRVGALLQSLEQTSALRVRLAEARALERWPELVGPHLAKKTRPLRVVGERLFVVAHGASLRQELLFHRKTIVRRFNETCGMKRITKVVFLESDANLSSVFEREDVAPEGNRIGHVSSLAGPEASAEEAGGSTVDESDVPTYRFFDAAAYREEMRRLSEGESESG